MELAKPLRKTPVLARVCYGFIGNRMMEGYAREAQRIVLEGATPRRVDSALEEWGMAMGILAVFDMAGIDVGVNVHKANASQYPPDPTYYQADIALHEAGRLGQKTGKGYYRYEPGNRTRIDDPEAHGDPRGARAASCGTAACAQQAGDPRALPVSAAERRLAHSRRGHRAARRRHRRGVDCRIRLSALSRRADVLRRDHRPAKRCWPACASTGDMFGPMHWEPAPLLVELVERGLSIAEWEATRREERRSHERRTT